jgi:Tol biopolymer transport system component
MTAGHVVGRVGGLAVALGVGTAIWLAAPSACADETSGSKQSESSQAHSRRAVNRPPTQRNQVAASRVSPPTAVLRARLPRPLGRDVDGRGTAPAVWLEAAAARREVDATAEPADATGISGIPIDSTHELATTESFTTTGGYSTQVALVDTSTGTQVGDTVTLASRLSQDPLVTADGKHVLIASGVDYNNPKNISQVAVLDIATGTQIGTTATFTGLLGDLHLVGTAGRIVAPVFLYDYGTGTSTTQFAVIDATTGTTVGSGLTLDGSPWDNQMLSVDGMHALVITSVLDQGNQPSATKLAVLDTTDGTQAGSTLTLKGGLSGDPLVSEDGIHVLVSANDDRYHLRSDSHTQIVVVNTITGAQAGATLVLDGHVSLGPVVNADGIHALFVAGEVGSTRIVVVDTSTGEHTNAVTLAGATGYSHVDADRAHVLVTATDGAFIRTAVVDTATGTQTSGSTISLAGPIGYTFTAPDDGHVLFAANDSDSTHIVVIDTATGQQTGSTVTLAGVLARALANTDDGHVLVATTDGDSTRIAVVDSTAGQQVGADVIAPGELWSWEQPLVTADGTRVFMITHSPIDEFDNWTHAVVIDTVTGSQAGTTVTLAGFSPGPMITADGDRATIITSVPASAKHGSSTHIAVIDTTTGDQLGTTIRLTGRPLGSPTLQADGYHIKITTTAGLRRNIDTTTGTAVASPARAPWGFDVEAFALTPLGQLVTAVQGAAFTAGAAMFSFVFFGLLALGAILSQ